MHGLTWRYTKRIIILKNLLLSSICISLFFSSCSEKLDGERSSASLDIINESNQIMSIEVFEPEYLRKSESIAPSEDTIIYAEGAWGDVTYDVLNHGCSTFNLESA